MSDTVIQVTNFENVNSEIVGLNLEWEGAPIWQNDENETMVLTKEKLHQETPCKNLLLSTKQGQYTFEVGAECL